MSKPRKVTADDAGAILPLLATFESEHDESVWRRLWTAHADASPGYCGYGLFEGERAVGFLAYTFSERTIRGQVRRLCNINNWIVRPEHRHASLTLLMPALRLKDTTLTNFTPTPEVRRICTKLGFQPLDGTQRIIPPGRLSLGATVITGARVAQEVGPEQRRLLDDHALPHHRHALIRAAGGECLLILNRTHKNVRGRAVPMLHCHHVGDRRVFARVAGHAATVLCARTRSAAMIVMERYLDRFPRLSLQRPGGRFEACFRPAEGVTAADIDGLYSEMTLLNY